MKHMQRTVALVLALVVVMAAFSTCALAADRYRVETLKKGTWYKVPYEDKANTIYKLALSADSIVTVNWKGNKTGNANFDIYTDQKCNNNVRYCIDDDKLSGSEIYVFTKGTYYIQMYEDQVYEDQGRPTSQVKVTVQKAVNQSNYCRAKAVSLKRNKTVKIAQTSNYCYDRWYRITLNSK